jgi:hypothetical protein
MKIVAILISADEEARADLLLLGDAIAKFATARYWPGLLSLLSMETLDELFKKYDDTKAVWAQVLKWGGVLGNLAAAKSAEDAQKILEGVAAPLGSYRAYRDGSWHGFISGYAGITAGTDKPTDGGERANSIAPFLPVGFEVGHSLGSNLTFHALVSVIDLGAPAMARFDNHDVDASMGMDDEIKAGVESDFASVFAPGAFVSVGLFDSPVVIGGGVELLPHSVRRFACDSASPCSNTVDVTTVRGMIFLAVDLTAFPIF